MFYVPDGTQRCGYYECEKCRQRFLDVRIAPQIPCPYCGEEIDMEIGPDDELLESKETARLKEMIQGEDVEKYDALLSLAITGGDYKWI